MVWYLMGWTEALTKEMVKAVCHSKERVGGVSSSTLKSAQGGGIDLYQLSWDSRNLLVVLQEAISPTHLSLLKKLLIAGAIVRHIVLLVCLFGGGFNTSSTKWIGGCSRPPIHPSGEEWLSSPCPLF